MNCGLVIYMNVLYWLGRGNSTTVGVQAKLANGRWSYPCTRSVPQRYLLGRPVVFLMDGFLTDGQTNNAAPVMELLIERE